jgi:branched-chain amino acid transport system permease protein
MIAIYTILTVSLDLLAGHTGLLSVAQGAFFGIGAYVSAVLALYHRIPFAVELPCAIIAAAAASFIISVPSIRIHGDYFVVATFALQLIIANIFNNWMAVTRGPLGLAGIPQPSLFGLSVSSKESYALWTGVAASLCYLVVGLLSRSPFGRVLRAIRDDEVFARSLGKNTLAFKVVACAVSAALAGVAGSLYAHYITYIDPTSFTVGESIVVISMLMAGGAGTFWGPLLGAALLTLLPEVLRFVGLPESVAASLRQIVYGAALVLAVIARPKGFTRRSRGGAWNAAV